MIIAAQPLNAPDFAPFGDVLHNAGDPDKLINEGMCGRYHDRARLDFGDGRAGLSIFDAVPRALPYTCDLLERHPEGSQAFIPMHQHPFLVIVAPDDKGSPGQPRAFVTAPGQGINLLRNAWHGVLTPLLSPGLFAVIDRVGTGPNLQEHRLDRPFTVHLATRTIAVRIRE